MDFLNRYPFGWVVIGLIVLWIVGSMGQPRREDVAKEWHYPDCLRKNWPPDQPSDEQTVAP